MVSILLAGIVVISFGQREALAFGESGGDGGCCGGIFPQELQDQASELETSFQNTAPEELRRQWVTETLCETNPCGLITEEQAKELLDRIEADKRRGEDRFLSWVGVAAGVPGFFMGLIALWRTFPARRRRRQIVVEANEMSGE
jgi:hypothetical protein